MPKIIAVLKGAWGHYSLVLDAFPVFEFERVTERFLVAHNDGFYQCYSYSNPMPIPGLKPAFAGRHFDIPLKGGGVVKATGQWWDGGHDQLPEPTLSVGIQALLELRLNGGMFIAGTVSKAKLEAWLAENTISPNLESVSDPC